MKAMIAFSLLYATFVLAQPPPEAVITPRAILRREIKTFGWYAVIESGETIYTPFKYDDVSNPIVTSDSYWVDWCGSTYCPIITDCLGGSAYYSSAANLDPMECTSDLHCLTDYLYESFGAESPLLTKIGCVHTTWLARNYYKKSPVITSDESSAPSSTTSGGQITGSALSNPTSSSTPGSTSLAPVSSSEAPVSPKSKAPNAGVIAGSVVGAIAVLGAIALGALYIIRRTRRSHTTLVTEPAETKTSYAYQAPPGYENAASPGYAYSPSHPAEMDGTIGRQDPAEMEGTIGRQDPAEMENGHADAPEWVTPRR